MTISTSASSSKTPVYYISHGSPFTLYDKKHEAYKSLQQIGKEITQQVKPTRGVVVFSAHWQGERRGVKVNVGEGDALLYDLYGFPSHFYSETFPHRGSRELALEILQLLKGAGIQAEGVNRNVDHGVWVPFKCMFDPKDNPLEVPIVQVSLYDNEDPDMHFALGQAVSKLRSEGVVVIGSGMAVHNLRDLHTAMKGDKLMDYVEPFNQALNEAVTTVTGDERRKKLSDLVKEPITRQAHPSFDHLFPIHIAAGAAGVEKAQQLFTKGEFSVGWAQYRFGEIPA